MPESNEQYAARKERNRKVQASMSAEGRDIGNIPTVIDPVRKDRGGSDFRFFCETYFPETFPLAWSDDHLKVIAKIERAVLHGGLFAVAMPRGSGKSSLTETACLWAILIGAHEFVALVGSDKDHAINMLDSIRIECEVNELLLEDYPEAIYPIRCLERIANRAKGQTHGGEPTRIHWVGNEIVMPTIAGSKASGAIIRVAGITGRIRGMKYKRADGRPVRPSLVVLDDPQTEESARSPEQIKTRMGVLSGAILNLAGPRQKISGIMPCTVIRQGDMADQILDHEKFPQWQGERTKMVYAFPTNEKLWNEYDEIRKTSFRNDGDGSEATEFYRDNRAAMDAGAVIAWSSRYNDDELSAIQNAMNLKLRDEAVFFAEYQNEPLIEANDGGTLLPEQVAERINGRTRKEMPVRTIYHTAYIDVHDQILYWVVVGWEEDFTAYVADYGTWPHQPGEHFTQRKPLRPLSSLYPGLGVDATIQAGLEALCGLLLETEWPKASGGSVRTDRLLVDAGYKPGIVDNVRHKVGTTMQAARGVGVRAGGKPMSSYRRKPGEKHGHFWYVPNVSKTGESRHVRIDTNYWKSFCHERLRVPVGDPGNMTLFGKKPAQHQTFASHIAGAEFSTQTEGHGRTVFQWDVMPGHPDNHWFDCLVGNCVAASMCGCRLPGHRETKKREKQKEPMKLSDIQKNKRQ